MNKVEPIRSKVVLRMIEQILSKNPRDRLFFTIGTNSGLRISDILGLDVGDVKGKNYIQLKEKKTGKYKRFPINAKLKPMIEDFIKYRRLEEPLFMTKFKNRLCRVSAYYIIRQACDEAGVEERVGTHTLRKTFGYHHYKQYKDVVMLQKIFNHSSPAITLEYIGIEQEEIDKSYTNFIL